MPNDYEIYGLILELRRDPCLDNEARPPEVLGPYLYHLYALLEGKNMLEELVTPSGLIEVQVDFLKDALRRGLGSDAEKEPGIDRDELTELADNLASYVGDPRVNFNEVVYALYEDKALTYEKLWRFQPAAFVPPTRTRIS